MVKAERGTPKDIANRMKSRGLQKLKFYCQMCEKQCRDQNGFKQHATSESHMRQMKIFTSNATGIVSEFSIEFEKSFLTTLKMRHGTKKVNANNIYQEMIAYKSHIHMNSTQWTTLTEFVQYLGKSGKCVVEENISDGQGGWYVSFIERDVGIIERREKQLKKDISNQLAEKLLQQRMNTQRVEAAKALDKMGLHSTKLIPTSILLDNDNKPAVKVVLSGLSSSSSLLKKKSNNKSTIGVVGVGGAFGNDEDDDDDDDDDDINDVNQKPRSKKDSVLMTMAAEGSSRRSMMIATATTDNNNDKTVTNRTGKRKHPSVVDSSSINNDKKEDGGRQEKKKQKKKSKSTLLSLSLSSEQHQQQQYSWLYRDIIVRIVSKKIIGGKSYFRKKAIIDKVLDDDDGYTAEVEIIDNDRGNGNDGNDGGGDILRLDQNDLETVIPKMKMKKNDNKNNDNNKVRILKGKYRGSKAKIQDLNKIKYQADLQIIKVKVQKQKQKHHGGGNDNNDDEDEDVVVGMVLKNIPYEDFSQIA